MSRKFLTPVGLPSGNTLPSVGSSGNLFFKDDEDAIYVYTGSAWANTKGSTYSVAETAPASPSSGDIWFNSATGKTFVYYDSFWVEPGQNNVGPTGATGPTGPTGAAGPTGPTGPTGASASDLDAWTTYTPSWTAASSNPSLGDGTLTGRYKQIGKTVFVFVKLVTGSTTTMGSGDWRFSLPVSAQNPDCIQMSCSMLDAGINWYKGTVNGTYAGLTDRSSIITDTANITSGAVTPTSPFTWGSGDSLMFNGSYEAA